MEAGIKKDVRGSLFAVRGFINRETTH
jgi:hypothetical protein